MKTDISMPQELIPFEKMFHELGFGNLDYDNYIFGNTESEIEANIKKDPVFMQMLNEGVPDLLLYALERAKEMFPLFLQGKGYDTSMFNPAYISLLVQVEPYLKNQSIKDWVEQIAKMEKGEDEQTKFFVFIINAYSLIDPAFLKVLWPG